MDTSRSFIKYVVGGTVVVAAAGIGGYYYLKRDPSTVVQNTTIGLPSWTRLQV